MARVTSSVLINRPIERVFDYVTTLENDPLWVSTSVSHRQVSGGTKQVGGVSEETIRFLGVTTHSSWKIIESVAPESFDIETIKADVPALIRYRLVTCETGTVLTLEIEARLTGIYKAVGPLAILAFKKQTRGDLDRLKAILEEEPIHEKHSPVRSGGPLGS